MARVPYNPVPEVTPRDVSTPSIHINAPSEAFGSAVAQGLVRARLCDAATR